MSYTAGNNNDKTITLELYEHTTNDPDCIGCWSGYPRKCGQCDKGLVHGEFNDTDYDDNVYLIYRCDHCGRDYDTS